MNKQTKIQHSTGLYTFDRDALSAEEMAECKDGKTCHATFAPAAKPGVVSNMGWVTNEGIDTAIAKLLATGGTIKGD